MEENKRYRMEQQRWKRIREKNEQEKDVREQYKDKREQQRWTRIKERVREEKSDGRKREI